MSEIRFGKSFCLVHKTGTLLYPVRIKDRDSGRVLFRVSEGGTGGNKKVATQQEDDEIRVFNLVVNEGAALRVASLDRKIQGQYKIGHRSIIGYKNLRQEPS